MSQVSVREVLLGWGAPNEVSPRNRIIGFIELQRPLINVIGFFPLVIAAAALAGGRLDDPRSPFGLVMVYFLVASSLIVNDLCDSERDKLKWPLRPLATGLISKTEATLYMFILAGLSFVIALVVFNWLSAAITFVIFILAYIYARYTRDNVGYLTVLIPGALIPLAVWAAISPGTIVTPVPWLLVALRGVYGMAVNTANEATDKVPVKPLFVHVRPFTEKVVYVTVLITSFFIGILIIYYAQVSWLYLIVLAVATAYAFTAVKSLGSQRSPKAVQKNVMIFAISTAVSLLGLAVFAWIK